MKQVRIERKVVRRRRDDRSPVLPLDPRDPAVVRAKRQEARTATPSRA